MHPTVTYVRYSLYQNTGLVEVIHAMGCHRGRNVKRSGYQMYSDSKLMLYMFTVELQKRLKAAGSTAETFAAHPGVAQTDAFRKSDKTKLTARILKSGADFIGQSAGGGAQSILRALTDPSLTGDCEML